MCIVSVFNFLFNEKCPMTFDEKIELLGNYEFLNGINEWAEIEKRFNRGTKRMSLTYRGCT